VIVSRVLDLWSWSRAHKLLVLRATFSLHNLFDTDLLLARGALDKDFRRTRPLAEQPVYGFTAQLGQRNTSSFAVRNSGAYSMRENSARIKQ
jgi:hypothetical protein